jgi:hypothetical protein
VPPAVELTEAGFLRGFLFIFLISPEGAAQKKWMGRGAWSIPFWVLMSLKKTVARSQNPPFTQKVFTAKGNVYCFFLC